MPSKKRGRGWRLVAGGIEERGQEQATAPNIVQLISCEPSIHASYRSSISSGETVGGIDQGSHLATSIAGQGQPHFIEIQLRLVDHRPGISVAAPAIQKFPSR